MQSKLKIILLTAIVVSFILMPTLLKAGSQTYWGIYFGMPEMGFYWNHYWDHHPTEVWLIPIPYWPTGGCICWGYPGYPYLYRPYPPWSYYDCPRKNYYHRRLLRKPLPRRPRNLRPPIEQVW